MANRQSREASVFPGEGVYSPASGLNSADLMPRRFNGSALPALASQGAGQQQGMLPLMLGLSMLQNNQARPYSQGPPSIGAGLAGGMQQYLQYQQQQQDQAAQQAQYDQQLGFKQRAEARDVEDRDWRRQDREADAQREADSAAMMRGIFEDGEVSDEENLQYLMEYGTPEDVLAFKQGLKPKLTQFTIKRGRKAFTYIGDKADESTWKLVGESSLDAKEKSTSTADQKNLFAYKAAKQALTDALAGGDDQAIAAAQGDVDYWTKQIGMGEKAKSTSYPALAADGSTRVLARENEDTNAIEWYNWDTGKWEPSSTFGQPFYKTNVSVQAASIDDASGDLTQGNENKYNKEFASAFAHARTFILQTNEALRLIEKNPASLTVAGDAARVIDTFTTGINSIVDMIVEKDAKLDLKSLKDDMTMFDSFKTGAVNNARYRSSMLDLGYGYAATLGGVGVAQKVTEADLRYAMKIIGGAAGSAEQLGGIISDVQERLLVRLESEVASQNRFVRGDDNQIDFDRSMLPEPLIVNWGEPNAESGVDMTGATAEQQADYRKLLDMGIFK